nr:MAG TPA: hypothetical protein [Caudoviricetes sp.]
MSWCQSKWSGSSGCSARYRRGSRRQALARLGRACRVRRRCGGRSSRALV